MSSVWIIIFIYFVHILYFNISAIDFSFINNIYSVYFVYSAFQTLFIYIHLKPGLMSYVNLYVLNLIVLKVCAVF